MRVLIISSGDLAGGANRAAFRIHQALRGIGVESFMAVRRKDSTDPHVHKMTPLELGWPPVGRGYLDMLPSIVCRRKDEPISLGLQSANIGALVNRFKPDIINLHWINGGIARIRSVGRLPVPVVWTLHDMWPFTGGCHYSGDCLQYRKTCSRCPKIKPLLGAAALSQWVYNRKRKHWGGKQLHAITPSAWMKELARSSSLFAKADITHIPNCIDPRIFNGDAREQTRTELGLAPHTQAILFAGANQTRKGADIIPIVIERLLNSPESERYRFLFLGGLPPTLVSGKHVVELARSTDEERIASYYAASDLYALPSLEDNLPNTISESLNCGTPVAAFPTGGIVEMVQEGLNGALSPDYKASSFQDAILRSLTTLSWSRSAIAHAARETYAPSVVATAYQAAFKKYLAAT
jgi:glycosyltransferase involved in cell wall biosynthesis